MAIEFVLLILAAYLVGSVPAAYLAAKWSRGMDLRQYGTGQIGAGNLWRMTSKWLTLPVFIFDLGKGMVMVWAAQLVGLGIAQQVTVGLAAIMGHNWPVFLRFSGGRGVTTALGVILILMPWGLVVFLIIGGIGMLILRSSSVPVLASMVVLPLVSWGLGQPQAITLGLLSILLIIVTRRLVVPQPAGATPISRKQLLLNRLLFDRDIRDRKAWLYRAPPEVSSTEQQGQPGKGL